MSLSPALVELLGDEIAVPLAQVSEAAALRCVCPRAALGIVRLSAGCSGPACGSRVRLRQRRLGIIIFGLLLSAALSLVASAFALASFRKLPLPRSGLRTLELALIAFPLLAGIVSVALLFLYA